MLAFLVRTKFDPLVTLRPGRHRRRDRLHAEPPAVRVVRRDLGGDQPAVGDVPVPGPAGEPLRLVRQGPADPGVVGAGDDGRRLGRRGRRSSSSYAALVRRSTTRSPSTPGTPSHPVTRPTTPSWSPWSSCWSGTWWDRRCIGGCWSASGAVWVIVTCADRLFAGAHFLSDVTAGVLLGCGLAAASYAGYVGWRPPDSDRGHERQDQTDRLRRRDAASTRRAGPRPSR